jgi:AcrR family transcriptional regulator
MSPRPNVSDERKEQILTAAEHVFTKKGFDQTRMDDIAEETGLGKGTLYLYFKSKDDLITALLERIFKGVIRQLDSRRDRQMGATEAILRFTEEAIHDYQYMLHILPIAYEFLSLAFRNKAVQKALTQYFRAYMEILMPIIQQGIDSGEFRRVDAREVAIAAGAIYEGTIVLWVYDKGIVDLEKNMRASIRLLLEGIQA